MEQRKCLKEKKWTKIAAWIISLILTVSMFAVNTETKTVRAGSSNFDRKAASVDTTPPELTFNANGATVIKDGETYYSDRDVKVKDEDAAITFKVNGTPIIPESGGIYVLNGNCDAEYKIEVSDSSGNTTSLTIYMKPISSLESMISSMTEQNIKTSDSTILDKVAAAINDARYSGAGLMQQYLLGEILDKVEELNKSLSLVSEELNQIRTEAKNCQDASKDKDRILKLIDRVQKIESTDHLTAAERKEMETLKEELNKRLSESEKPLPDPEKPVSEKVMVSSIKINASAKRIYKGNRYQLKASALPSNASNKKIVWKSSNPKVASVDSKGKVTARNYGRTTITAAAADGSKKSTYCRITVPYRIKYKLNKGRNHIKNPSSYYQQKISLKNPTRRGYTFKGWYQKKSFKKKITKISKSSKKNYTLYAK